MLNAKKSFKYFWFLFLCFLLMRTLLSLKSFTQVIYFKIQDWKKFINLLMRCARELFKLFENTIYYSSFVQSELIYMTLECVCVCLQYKSFMMRRRRRRTTKQPKHIACVSKYWDSKQLYTYVV